MWKSLTFKKRRFKTVFNHHPWWLVPFRLTSGSRCLSTWVEQFPGRKLALPINLLAEYWPDCFSSKMPQTVIGFSKRSDTQFGTVQHGLPSSQAVWLKLSSLTQIFHCSHNVTHKFSTLNTVVYIQPGQSIKLESLSLIRIFCQSYSLYIQILISCESEYFPTAWTSMTDMTIFEY